ncbi:hypothetical protein [Neorhizobium galegae]|uniref:hypothetical protein n=1 Tax=Neorhizobium galegae TaxID=399 RepID=UPI00138DF33A|nr:hypothetical protein [Neorhizobium galegae]
MLFLSNNLFMDYLSSKTRNSGGFANFSSTRETENGKQKEYAESRSRRHTSITIHCFNSTIRPHEQATISDQYWINGIDHRKSFS